MFIARQPIFNKKLDVFGYELLYRSGIEANRFDGASSQGATATVIGGLFESGIDQIVNDKYAFINFDEEFIHSNALELIAPDRLVVEMLENVKIDSKLIDRLKDIKKKGYKIALDDFVEKYEDYPLTPLADIIKFDLLSTPLKTIEADVRLALAQNKILLAEKVETKEEFFQAKEMGFHLFQGYFFSKPSIAAKSDHEKTSSAQYALLLKELKKEEPDFQVLAEIIEKDVTLAYRIMRIASSRSEEKSLYSIKRALTYMGLKEFDRWINVLILQDLGKSKPEELVKISLIRTKFAESIALHGGLKNMRYEASMMGLFSILDAMLDRPISEALKDIALPNSITEALIENKGVLSPVYELLLAYEKGDWLAANKISERMKINRDSLFAEYLEAIRWTNETFEQTT